MSNFLQDSVLDFEVEVIIITHFNQIHTIIEFR